MYRIARLFLIGFILLFSTAPLEAKENPPSAQQYINARSIENPEISSDGSRFAFLWNVTGTNQVWAAKTDAQFPEQITFFEENVAFIKWSPSEDLLIVGLGNSPEEITQFYSIHSDGTGLEKRSPADNCVFRNIVFSKDGKQLAYASNEQNPEVFDTYIYTLATKENKLAAKDQISSLPISFSPDQKYLLISKGENSFNNDLYLIDLEANALHLLTQHEGSALFCNGVWTPDSKSFYLTTTQKRDRKTLALMTLVKQGKKPIRGKMSYIDLGEYEVSRFNLSADGKYFSYTLNQDGYFRTVAQNLKTRDVIELERQDEVTKVEFLPGGKKYLVTYASPTGLPEFFLCDLSSKNKTAIGIAGYAGLSRQAFVKPKVIQYYSFDKAKIPALLYLPKDTKTDSTLTMIVYFHDGPKSQAPYYFDPLIQYLVANGYGVIAPNIRGSSGYGPAYEQADNLTGREAALKDATAITEWLKLSGFANPKKIVALGSGYGGYTALSMISLYPESWAAGISINGMTNLLSVVRSAKGYQKNELINEYGNPDKDAEFLQKFSPSSHASAIKQPIMLVQGKANDDTEQFINTVRSNGVTVQYIRFDNASEKISKPENLTKTYTEIVRFVEANVRTSK